MIEKYGELGWWAVASYYAAKARGYRTACGRHGFWRTLRRTIARAGAARSERRYIRKAGLTEYEVDTLLSGEPTQRDSDSR